MGPFGTCKHFIVEWLFIKYPESSVTLLLIYYKNCHYNFYVIQFEPLCLDFVTNPPFITEIYKDTLFFFQGLVTTWNSWIFVISFNLGNTYLFFSFYISSLVTLSGRWFF